MIKVGLWVSLQAKAGKENALEHFLKSALEAVMQEDDTLAWYALRLSPSHFAIFDAFPHEAGRESHLTGKVAAALMSQGLELLAEDPKIEKLEVLATKPF